MPSGIIGAHGLLYSDNPEADRAFFRDILICTVCFWTVVFGACHFIWFSLKRRRKILA